MVFDLGLRHKKDMVSELGLRISLVSYIKGPTETTHFVTCSFHDS